MTKSLDAKKLWHLFNFKVALLKHPCPLLNVFITCQDMRETTSISFLGIKEETGKYVRSALYELLKRIMFPFTSKQE